MKQKEDPTDGGHHYLLTEVAFFVEKRVLENITVLGWTEVFVHEIYRSHPRLGRTKDICERSPHEKNGAKEYMEEKVVSLLGRATDRE